jgi:hypothetical protein
MFSGRRAGPDLGVAWTLGADERASHAFIPQRGGRGDVLLREDARAIVTWSSSTVTLR